MNETKFKLPDFLKKIPPKWLIIIGLSGIVLIALSSVIGSDNTQKIKDTKAYPSGEEYCDILEEKVKEIVESITGEKSPTVAVTLETGTQYLYAGDEKSKVVKTEENSGDKTSADNSEETEKGYIIVKDSSGDEKAVIVTEYMPEIRGVAIVCRGGKDATINEEIVNAVTSALGISPRKIYVTSKNY